KGFLEYAFAGLGLEVSYEPSEDSILQRGRTAKLIANGVTLGVIGEIQDRILENFDLEAHPAAMFEIGMDALLSALGDVSLTYQSSSPYPESYRDLAIVVDEDVTVSRIREIIERHALVVGSAPFDIYSGEGVEEGRKSVAFRVVFQSDRGTLTSEQVDRFQNDILRQLSRNLNAELRS
ncbi:MAG: phenylalanine--tRNA ligase subunit beta, partial [Dehalococcoidia bacterium]|nr:phenylalanine--tRNA ligase subunit beta [Dehalococcoidia bacterium]